jgi:hypothetical protein
MRRQSRYANATRGRGRVPSEKTELARVLGKNFPRKRRATSHTYTRPKLCQASTTKTRRPSEPSRPWHRFQTSPESRSPLTTIRSTGTDTDTELFCRECNERKSRRQPLPTLCSRRPSRDSSRQRTGTYPEAGDIRLNTRPSHAPHHGSLAASSRIFTLLRPRHGPLPTHKAQIRLRTQCRFQSARLMTQPTALSQTSTSPGP